MAEYGNPKLQEIMQFAQQAHDREQQQQAQQGNLANALAKQKSEIGAIQGLTKQNPNAALSVGDVHYNPMTMAGIKEQSAEAQKVLGSPAKHSLDKMEEGLQAASTGTQFLQNPNLYNQSDVKALAVQLQGLPARAFGAEAKASGFDPGGWNKAIQGISQYSDDPKANPLTPETLDTLRNNWGVMVNALKKKHQGTFDSYWNSQAPKLSPLLAKSGDLDQMKQAEQQRISNTYGDVLNNPLPWKNSQAQSGQAAQQTAPAQNTGIVGKALNALHGWIGGNGTQQAQGPQSQAQPGLSSIIPPQGVQPPQAQPPGPLSPQDFKAAKAAGKL